jgi:hypothetical protein
MAYIGKTPVLGNFVKLDAISVVNGQAAYTMQNGGVNFTSYDNVNQFLVSLNGILQSPTDSFTVSGSTLTFASNLSTGDVIDFVMVLGNTLDVGTPSDNTVSLAKINDTAKTFFTRDFRNLIINGDMSIAQRGTSTSGLGSDSSQTYVLDRFKFQVNGAVSTARYTVSQDTDVPSGQGFVKSSKIDITTADASLNSAYYSFYRQEIEGQNLQYLKKGTANAESVTMSFWVKSNKTGTYICEIDDNDNSRNINKSYTINSANTWEKKTITFAGDTTGTLDNDNGSSFRIFWWLAAGTDFTSGTLATDWEATTSANRAVGQVNLADSTANEWYITGVQLEAGTTASDFEFLPYDVNLDRCERYYQVYTGTSTSSAVSAGIAWNTTNTSNHILAFRNMMRTTPTLIQSSLDLRDPVSADYSATISISGGSSDSIQLGSSGSSGLVARRMYWIATNGGYLHFDGEL